MFEWQILKNVLGYKYDCLVLFNKYVVYSKPHNGKAKGRVKFEKVSPY